MSLDLYRSLFVHRDDVFAMQYPDGAYRPVPAPLTNDDIQEHLDGQASYGVYVIKPVENTVSYIVFDLDIMDEDAAIMLLSCICDMKLIEGDTVGGDRTHVLREFSGNKGTHYWLFFSEPIAAEKVRRWVAADFMPKWQKVATENGWPAGLEVFPKQDGVPEGGFGNLIKLPLGIHAVSGRKSEIVSGQGLPESVEEVVPLPVELVPERTTPAGTTRRQRSGGTGSAGPHTPFPCIDTIMREGVGSGYRDNAMFRLALYCYGHGLDEDLALEVCERANENFDPPLRAAEVQHKVSSAYTGRYHGAGCGSEDWLRDICPGPCAGGFNKGLQQPSALRGVHEGEALEVVVERIQVDGGKRRLTISHPDADNTPTLVASG